METSVIKEIVELDLVSKNFINKIGKVTQMWDQKFLKPSQLWTEKLDKSQKKYNKTMNTTKMSMLGAWFAARRVQGAMLGLFSAASNALGIQTMWNTTLEMVFLPILMAIYPILLNIMMWFMNLPGPVKIVIGAIAGLITVMAVLITLLLTGQYIAATFAGNTVLIAVGAGIATAATWTWNAALVVLDALLSPVALVIIAIVAAIALLAFAIYSLIRWWPQLSTTVSKSMKNMQTSTSNALNSTEKGLRSFRNHTDSALMGSASDVPNIWNPVVQFFVDSWNTIHDLWSKSPVSTPGSSAVSTPTSNNLTGSTDIANTAAAGTALNSNSSPTPLENAWQNVASWLQTNVWDPIGKAATNLWNSIPGAAQAAWNWIKTAWNNAVTWLDKNVWQPISNFGKNAWTSITNTAKDAWNWIKTAWSDAGKWFADLFKGIVNSAISLANGILSTIQSVINGIIDGINWIINKANSSGLTKIFGGAGISNISHVAMPSIPMMQDFIWRPGEGAVGISPQDNVIGMKDLSNLGSVTINQTINATTSNKQEIMNIVNEANRQLIASIRRNTG